MILPDQIGKHRELLSSAWKNSILTMNNNKDDQSKDPWKNVFMICFGLSILTFICYQIFVDFVKK